MQKVLGIAVALLAIWFMISLFAPTGGGEPARAWKSSAECATCHAEIYAEWQGSQHSKSWTNPLVRERSNDFANQDCIDCHAPRPVFITGIAERVLPRSTMRNEGVDCLSCHQLPNHADGTPGGMAGGVRNSDAPCRPEERRELVRPDFCAGCHNQHKTVDQWSASDFAKGVDKQDCLDCHMPWVEPLGTAKKHRSHVFPGGDSTEMLKRAVTLTGAPKDGSWSVTLTNVGAGHSYPTDERSRTSDVFWRPLTDDEGAPWNHMHRIRSPYRDEVGVPDTLLLAGEARVLPVTSESEGAGEAISSDTAIEVALFYRRTPIWEDLAHPADNRGVVEVARVVLQP
jgi:nitrate/TMAO reductase-like tetraheme cytochrome c subunit